MPEKNTIIFLMAIMALIAGPWGDKADADEIICPGNIAAIEDDYLSQWAKNILSGIYGDMGCETVMTDLPPRRGIHHFNNGKVDGELYRLRQVEKLYTRKFQRSGMPLFRLSNSLWLHPKLKNNERYLIGYIGGVVWQENYMKGRPGKAFASSQKMFQAYNKGQIKGFLAADPSVQIKIKNSQLTPVPEKGKVLLEEPLYHYVGEEFGAFINAFTQKLESHPFKEIEGN